MKNIVLAGFMGTGKTATARVLAQRLKRRYLSTDEEIERRQSLKVSDIFKLKGEAYFRGLEANLAEELGSVEGLIIDTGGGVVLNLQNIQNFKKNGIIICLTSSAEKIFERTKKYAHRPLLEVANPLEKIKELLKVREPFYQQADYFLDTTNLTVQETADRVMEILRDVK